MAKPSSERIRKAQEACRETVQTLRRHPEFDEHREDQDRSIHRRERWTNVTANVRFSKSGSEIFRNPPELEDHDFPVLVGGKVLTQALRKAARTATLKMTHNVRLHIAPSEKGWVEIGYQFLH